MILILYKILYKIISKLCYGKINFILICNKRALSMKRWMIFCTKISFYICVQCFRPIQIVYLCIGEIWWMLWLCGLVYMYIGGFCWWLWIFELGSNCVSYLLVLIHLVNLFDDNYFGNSNEVRFVYVCMHIYIHTHTHTCEMMICMYIYKVVIPLIMIISCLYLWNDELYLLS